MKKIARFIVSVKSEMKKVRWSNKKEMVAYSVATISIVLIFMAYFTSVDLIIAGIKVLVG